MFLKTRKEMLLFSFISIMRGNDYNEKSINQSLKLI